jgi:hypothetical protein
MLAAIVQGASPAIARELPLGSPRLEERRAAVRVAPGVVWTRIVREGGPWLVNVLRIDRRALTGRLGGVLSNGRVAGREPASATARRARAVAGVNGGFFRADGDPVGALAIGSRLLSEPLDGRTALLVPLDRALGARDALNLDGGGSTTMTVSGEVVNLPSDPEGERPVSNGVFVLP